MAPTTPKTAVVLFNLGGPDSPEAIEPFLFNLFNDPAIISKPGPLRWVLAKLISKRRAPVAGEIYRHLGGKSPLLEETEAQAAALENALGRVDDKNQYAAFIAMRYWHPMSDQAAEAVKAFDPDCIVLLPLYPQFSTTTTESSLKDWQRAAKAVGLDKPTHSVCCYPLAQRYISGLAALVGPLVKEAGERGALGVKPRVLFSAHGLPEKVIAGGDPYQWQIEQTAAAVAEALSVPDLDWTVCYQSRVGPLKWIGPSLDDELKRAGDDGVPVVVVPIAFVSEHSETLVELDIEYRKLADELNVPGYIRVPAIGVEENFIVCLAEIVRDAADREPGIRPMSKQRICPAAHGRCPL